MADGEKQPLTLHRLTTYGSAYDSTGGGTDGNLTDGGAWTDVEALVMLRQQRYRKGSLSSAEDEPVSPPRPPWGLFVTIGLIGFAVDFAWAAMEAVMVPHLTDDLGASMETASLIWLVNPVFGVFVQPLLGRAMDQYGTEISARRPFVLGLAATAVVGLMSLVFLGTLHRLFRLSFTAVIVLCFVCFGVADIAHDCLLIPGRVLVGDVAGQLSSRLLYEQGHAVFSGMQGAGHLAAVFLGMVPLASVGLPASWDPYHSLLTMSAILIGCSCVWVCMQLKPEPPSPPSTPDTPEGPSRARSLDLNLMRKVRGRRRKALPGQAHAWPLLEVQQRRRRWVMPLPEPFEVAEEDKSSAHTIVEVLEERALIVLILLLTLFGWISSSAVAFYWTAWLGMDALLPGTPLRLAFFTLCVQAVTCILATAAMPYLNRRFGDVTVFIVSQLSFAVCMMLTVAWRGPLAVMALSLVLGVMPGIHPNNSLTICERLVDSPHLRASVVALVNTMMPIGQIIIGLCSGPLITHLHGDVAMYFALLGVLHLVVLALCAGILCIESLAD